MYGGVEYRSVLIVSHMCIYACLFVLNESAERLTNDMAWRSGLFENTLTRFGACSQSIRSDGLRRPICYNKDYTKISYAKKKVE